jgi:hypothetical protein
VIVHAGDQFHISQLIFFAESHGVVKAGEIPRHVDASGLAPISFDEHTGVRITQGSFHS